MLRTGGEAPSRGSRLYDDDTLRAGEQGTSTSVAGRSSAGVLERPSTTAGGPAPAPGAGRQWTRLAERDEDGLVAAVRSGDDDAFELIYLRYRERIGSYVRGLVGDYARAEDITQEVFLSALRRMRQTGGQLLLKPWLYEIAKNACIDHFRRTRRAEEVPFEGEFQLGPAEQDRVTAAVPGPDAMIDTKHRLDTLRGAFGSLSDIHHEILILRELEGRSYREIGERLGLTRPAVESTLFRARRRLVQEYDELDSGRSCLRVQGSIGMAAARRLGARDRRRIGKHLSHCAECRRHAALLGVGREELAPVPQRAMARVAALVPWPLVFLRRLVEAKRQSPWLATSGHGARMARWSGEISQTGDGAGMVWSKLVVSAVAVAALSMGAGHLPSGGGAAHPAPRTRTVSPGPTVPARAHRSRASTRASHRTRHHLRLAAERRAARAERRTHGRQGRQGDGAVPLPFRALSGTPTAKHLKISHDAGRRAPHSRGARRRDDASPSLGGFSGLPGGQGQSRHHPLSRLLARVTSLVHSGVQRVEGSRPRVEGVGAARRAGRSAAAGGPALPAGANPAGVHSAPGPLAASAPPAAAPNG